MTPYEMIVAENDELARMLHREHDRAVKLNTAIERVYRELDVIEVNPYESRSTALLILREALSDLPQPSDFERHQKLIHEREHHPDCICPDVHCPIHGCSAPSDAGDSPGSTDDRKV